MKITQEVFNYYIRILDENTTTSWDILNVLNDIVRGDWDNSVKYCLENPSGDPMDDFNYAGSRHHY